MSAEEENFLYELGEDERLGLGFLLELSFWGD
jgi:hypothetical protein